jgi:hypothetical protein
MRPTLLRLRESTFDMLRAELRTSAHRSLASLADEILEDELRRRGHRTEADVDRMITAAREIS